MAGLENFIRQSKSVTIKWNYRNKARKRNKRSKTEEEKKKKKKKKEQLKHENVKTSLLSMITASGASVGSFCCGSSTPPLRPPCGGSGAGPPGAPPGGAAEACWQSPPAPSPPRPRPRHPPYLLCVAFRRSRTSSAPGGSRRCTPCRPTSRPPRSRRNPLPGCALAQGQARVWSGRWSCDAEQAEVWWGAAVVVELGVGCLERKNGTAFAACANCEIQTNAVHSVDNWLIDWLIDCFLSPANYNDYLRTDWLKNKTKHTYIKS